jgi:hypothetical protein
MDKVATYITEEKMKRDLLATIVPDLNPMEHS